MESNFTTEQLFNAGFNAQSNAHKLYLEYTNNFITLEAFTQYYNFPSKAIAGAVLDLGRLVHEYNASANAHNHLQ